MRKGMGNIFQFEEKEFKCVSSMKIIEREFALFNGTCFGKERASGSNISSGLVMQCKTRDKVG
jgi:hypothetical protein